LLRRRSRRLGSLEENCELLVISRLHFEDILGSKKQLILGDLVNCTSE